MCVCGGGAGGAGYTVFTLICPSITFWLSNKHCLLAVSCFCYATFRKLLFPERMTFCFDFPVAYNIVQVMQA